MTATTRTITVDQLRAGHRIVDTAAYVDGLVVAVNPCQIWDDTSTWVEVKFTNGRIWQVDDWETPVTIEYHTNTSKD